LRACHGLAPAGAQAKYPAAFDDELEELRAMCLKDVQQKRAANRANIILMPEGDSIRLSGRDDMRTPLSQHVGVSLVARIWDISNIDVSATTFDVKFHLFISWYDPSAVGVKEGVLKPLKSGAEGWTNSGDRRIIVVPEVVIRNAVNIMVEDKAKAKVVDSSNGMCSCRAQYQARIRAEYDLRTFPFDCQLLEVSLGLECGSCDIRVEEGVSEITDQPMNLENWRLSEYAVGRAEGDAPSRVSMFLLVEREVRYYIFSVLLILCVTSYMTFAFYLLDAEKLGDRFVDLLKVALAQTSYKFSIEARLPKVADWTALDVYVVSCQVLFLLIAISFVIVWVFVVKLSSCVGTDVQPFMCFGLLITWTAWNIWWICHGNVMRRQMLNKTNAAIPERLPRPSETVRDSVLARVSRTTISSPSSVSVVPALVSVAFRIWLIRNIDPIAGTFECKFRVFLEWLDEDARGLVKGKKCNIPVPDITIANALTSKVLDKSSAPEVVDPQTGHLATQILYQAKLQLDQAVVHFPFDCQWLAITLSLCEGAGDRRFLFQYCEIDGQLKFDEWTVLPEPAFSVLARHQTVSIQDTVMCGVLVRRCPRYYVVNIMAMMCLLTLLTFSIYFMDVTLFWERAEVFLGIYPLVVVFKLSAQGKLPKVNYSTKFDRYASDCQFLFHIIIAQCVIFALIIKLPVWFAVACDADGTDDVQWAVTLRGVELYFLTFLLFCWACRNVQFCIRAWGAFHLEPVEALDTRVLVRLQDQAFVNEHHCKEPCPGFDPARNYSSTQSDATNVSQVSQASEDAILRAVSHRCTIETPKSLAEASKIRNRLSSSRSSSRPSSRCTWGTTRASVEGVPRKRSWSVGDASSVSSRSERTLSRSSDHTVSEPSPTASGVYSPPNSPAVAKATLTK